MTGCEAANLACSSTRSKNLKKGGGKRKSRQILTDPQRAFCSAYVRTGSAYGAAMYAGYHPASGYRLLENPVIQVHILKLQGQAERNAERRADRKFAVDRELLDVNLAHLIMNGETHPVRGDADKVKAIELGYRALGVIQPSHVVNQAVATNATRVSVDGRTMREVYKSRWLIEREAAIASQLEERYGRFPNKDPGS